MKFSKEMIEFLKSPRVPVFGELTNEERECLEAAGMWEICGILGWTDMPDPSWNSYNVYRIHPDWQPEPEEPWEDFDVLEKGGYYMAQIATDLPTRLSVIADRNDYIATQYRRDLPDGTWETWWSTCEYSLVYYEYSDNFRQLYNTLNISYIEYASRYPAYPIKVRMRRAK